MKICIIGNGFPTLKDPQRGCFEKDQALALLHAGHEVSILYVDVRMPKYGQGFWTSHETEDGLNVFSLSFPIPYLLGISYKLHYRVVSLLYDYVFKYMLRYVAKPDIIHAHFLYNIAYAVSLKQNYGIPLIGTEHWSKLNEKTLPKHVHFWADIAYNNVDCLISVADSLKTLIRYHFNKDAVVLHNMIGEEFLNIPRKSKRDGKIRIVSTGSLIYRKGFDVLINALSRIDSKLPEWELQIIGEGKERAILQQMINNFNMSNKIHLIGRRTKKDIIELYSESDFFILSSRAENFSVAVLEALAAGMPVIATLCGGIRECIDKNNGLLVPVDDIESLSNSIMYMVTNMDRYNSDYITENCKQRFSPSVIAHNLTNIYEKVLIKK